MKEAQYAHRPPLDNDRVIGTNQCLCLPKAELNIKTQPNGSSAVVWLSFWFSTRFTRKNLSLLWDLPLLVILDSRANTSSPLARQNTD